MIVKATMNDRDYLLDATERMVKDIAERSKDPYFLNLREDRREMYEQILQDHLELEKDLFVFICLKEEKPVGFALGGIVDALIPISKLEHVGVIKMCWVEEDFRGTGIAKELSEAIEEWFTKRNIQHIEVTYMHENDIAAEVWAGLGYKAFRVHARKTV